VCLAGTGTGNNALVKFDWCRDEENVINAHPCTFNKYLWDYDQETQQIRLATSGQCYAQTVYRTASTSSPAAASASCGGGEQHFNSGFSLHSSGSFKRSFHCCPKQGTCGAYFGSKKTWGQAYNTCKNRGEYLCDQDTIQSVCPQSGRALCQWGDEVEFRDRTCLEVIGGSSSATQAGVRTKSCTASKTGQQAWDMNLKSPMRIQNHRFGKRFCLSGTQETWRTLYDEVNPSVTAVAYKCNKDRREEKMFMCGYAQDKDSSHTINRSPCEKN